MNQKVQNHILMFIADVVEQIPDCNELPIFLALESSVDKLEKLVFLVQNKVNLLVVCEKQKFFSVLICIAGIIK